MLNRAEMRRLQMDLAQALEAAEEASRRAAHAEENVARLGDELAAARAAVERAQDATAADRCLPHLVSIDFECMHQHAAYLLETALAPVHVQHAYALLQLYCWCVCAHRRDGPGSKRHYPATVQIDNFVLDLCREEVNG